MSIRAKVEFIDQYLTTRLSVLWRKIMPYLSVSVLLYMAFSFLFGSIPWLSLLQKILHVWNFQIELVGLPQLLLAEYQRLRSIALRHIIEFVQLTIPIPVWIIDIVTTWAADLLIVYFLFAFSVVRASAINRRYDRNSLLENREAFEGRLRSAARYLHLDESNLTKRVEYGLQPGLFPWVYFQWRIWRSGLRWPLVIKRNIAQLRYNRGADHAAHNLTIITTALACALLGVIFYLMLSRVSSI